jgi:hypothetical protein
MKRFKTQLEQGRKEPEAQKSVFEDERLNNLSELDEKELEQLEEAIRKERNERIAPLERLAEDYLEQYSNAAKNTESLQDDTETLMTKLDGIISAMEAQKHDLFGGASPELLVMEVKQLLQEFPMAKDEEIKLLDIFRQINNKIHELDNIYFELEQRVGDMREKKEAKVMEEAESITRDLKG